MIPEMLGAKTIALLARLDQGVAQSLPQAEPGTVDPGEALLAVVFTIGAIGGTIGILHRLGWLESPGSLEDSQEDISGGTTEE